MVADAYDPSEGSNGPPDSVEYLHRDLCEEVEDHPSMVQTSTANHQSI